ncbi:MAG: hypothetical protein V5B60_20190 [Accumulibacter sp.]|jgi:hypothetical protein|uniref:hypothetical protein n=1 Tax=Accumulibacter sp. TaxID=2053492 RepID=UPI002FC2F122
MTATTGWQDPVVAEIHATRERLAEQYQHDLLAYSEAAEAHCRALGLIMAEDQRRAAEMVRGGLAVVDRAHPGSAADAVRSVSEQQGPEMGGKE